MKNQPKEEALSLYEKQLNFVESMVSFHPGSLGMFSEDELRLFREYFLPDWGAVSNFRDYYLGLESKRSDASAATALLHRYLDAHNVEGREALLPD